MIILKKITGRNFLSIGNTEQTVILNNEDLTLIVGENRDVGGNGSANGVGKSVILQMISYALFGVAVSNIKKDNLINRTNQKNMSATVEFSVRDIEYKIIRSRKPNNLKFFINDTEQVAADDSQGDSRETQEAIERVLCMSSTMFQHIVGLNSYTTPFLAMKVSDQREVIEQLLGITLLSEKADAIKELNRQTKEEIQREEYRIRGIDEANRRIQEQIDALVRRQTMWQKKHSADIDSLVNEYSLLSKIDIESELKAHGDRTIYLELVKQKENFNNLKSRHLVWTERRDSDVFTLNEQLVARSKIDIEAELAAHVALSSWLTSTKDSADLKKLVADINSSLVKEKKAVEKLKLEVKTLEENKCYACGQEFHDDNHTSVIDKKRQALAEASLQVLTSSDELATAQLKLLQLGDIGEKPVTHYASELEAVKHGSEIAQIQAKIESRLAEQDPYASQLLETLDVEVGDRPVTHYATETEAIEHRSRVANLEQQISAKTSDTDPYVEQIDEMKSTGIIELDYSTIDSLNKLLKHQDYLLDLLTNKKSFVRKKIISQNLAYLNIRLSYYLTQLGLPHRVVFQDDLSVEITDMGREADFDAFSRGERNRVILGLSFAFRDVFENLASPINLLFVDELMDSGMDSVGVENGLAVLKDMSRRRNKSVWLVSHREELRSRVDSTLLVVKENGFTSFALADAE